MGKDKRNRGKRIRILIVVVSLLILLGVLVLFVMPQTLYRMHVEPAPTEIIQGTASQNRDEETIKPEEDNTVEVEPEKAGVFPAELVEGNIEIENLFPFSGINPDADNQKATDVASVVVKNLSDKYLSEATVLATLDSGAELMFVVRDIPAGAAVTTFSVDNTSISDKDVCKTITAEAVFTDVPNVNGVEISVEGLAVTITNTSSEDLSEIDVYYRDVFNEIYFGGMAYSYKIEHLPAGESTTFTADRSILGVIEVVHVAVNDKN